MTGVRHNLVAVVLSGLAACGSAPVEDHYYSLVLAADDMAAVTATDAASTHLVVGPVELPDYLDQRGLTMQTGANQIRAANHNFWAEPLQEAIEKVLVSDIARLTSGITVDRDAGRWTGSGDCRVRIEFDKFHATSNSRVVSSGRYWVVWADGSVRQEFNVAQTLSADGYAHAVAALRQTLESLAEKIRVTIDDHSSCAG